MQQTKTPLSEELQTEIDDLAREQNPASRRLDRLSDKLGKRARERGIREADIPGLVKEVRRENQTRGR